MWRETVILHILSSIHHTHLLLYMIILGIINPTIPHSFTQQIYIFFESSHGYIFPAFAAIGMPAGDTRKKIRRHGGIIHQ